MKKPLGIILSISLAFSVLALPVFAEVDTTTSATVEANAPAATVAPAKPAAPAAAPAVDTSKLASGSYHTVVSGDVFWKIAANHGLTVDALAKLNPQIKNINVIYPGQKIIVKAETAAAPAAPAVAPTSGKLYLGIGMLPNYRIRNGNNDNLNITTASVLFDANGKIVDLEWDVLEITPTLFPGWMDPAAEDSVKAVYQAAQKDGWNWHTKREEGYDYDMTHLKSKGAADNASGKEWFEQLDVYEKFFTGKTVAEVEAWFNKYTDVNGRPYKMAYPEKLTDADKAAVAAFTDAEKKMLVDVTTGATMSLKDPHSDFITSLKKAYEDRKEVK